jgi:exodeoxyribonuclease V gamma subunit
MMPVDPPTMHTTRLTIHTANRLDVLADNLVERVRQDPLPPLVDELVVVQSQGMRRWIRMHLARRAGIAAGIEAPFPRSVVDRIAAGVDGKAAEDYRSFTREGLTWRLYALLGQDVAPAAVAPYLAGEAAGLKRFQLATRLAGLFDDYQLYRSDMLLDWEAGEAPRDAAGAHPAAAWQSRLWQALTTPVPGASAQEPASSRLLRLVRTLEETGQPQTGLPPRLSVFGVSSLPPLFLDLLGALARHIDVDIYAVTPTLHYWADIRSQAEQSRLGAGSGNAGDLHVDTGNQLLASLGRQGRDYFGLLEDRFGHLAHERPDTDVERPDATTLLGRIQTDILDLTDRRPGAPDVDARPVPMPGADDRSLLVHVCHSPMREMEVLRDQLYDAFARDPELRPEDVLVMVPDMAEYASYVEAVFQARHRPDGDDDLPPLPVTLADRPQSRVRPVVDAFGRLLAVARTRLTAADMEDLLATDAVAARFGISEAGLETVRGWIEALAVRWGADATHRRELLDHDMPAAGTWREALDRLLLGHACGGGEDLVAGVAPEAGDTAYDTDLLGRAVEMIETLLARLDELRRPTDAGHWVTRLRALVDAVFQASAEEESDLTIVRRAIDTLQEAADVLGAQPLELEVVRSWLSQVLADDGYGTGFLRGGITFCALKPMRTIPFDVIFVAGLGDRGFPRRERPWDFDLMAAQRRPGDRVLREDDRWLFLETLLAARKRLVLSYVGRSERDNSALAPSAVLAELLDCVDRTFVTTDGSPPRRHITVEHPLQAFSPRYFRSGDDARLFSFDRRNLALGLTEAGEDVPFSARALAAAPPCADAGPQAAVHEIDLDALAEFWAAPAAAFARRTLGIRLPERVEADDGAEPFRPENLDRYQIRDWLLRRRLDGRFDPDVEATVLAERGLAPLGNLAAPARERTERDVASVAAEVLAHRVHDPRPLVVTVADEDGARWSVVATLSTITDEGLLAWRPGSKPGGKDRMRAAVRHAFWQLARGPEDPPAHTLVLACNERWELGPLEDPGAWFATVVAGYVRGLRQPQPFFPEASWAWAKASHKARNPKGKGNPPDPLAEALKSWKTGGYADAIPGESEDAFVRLVWRDQEPLEAPADAFVRWADAVCTPLVEASS